nr:hypothetical protein [Tanacetum cinerariifolium]
PSGTSGAPKAFGSQVTPPPPPPTSTNQDNPSKGFDAPSPSKTAASTEHQAWTMPDVTLKPLVSLTPEDLDMDEAMGPDEQAQLSNEEDIRSITSANHYHWGGPPGQVTIQSNFFFNKDLEYLRYGSKGRRPALSISKMKAAYYPDAGLEQMVPDQFWIEEECKYDIAAITVRTHMRILSVIRIKVFFLYGYDYMKKIVLHRANLNEHVIRVEDFQIGIESYQTQVNLTKPQWTTTGFEYKHDYTVIESHTIVIFRDKYGVQMMMRFNETHKLSDGTLHQIVEALDYRVKEFRINRMNPGLNTRFWTRKDVDRCNTFMFAIQRRLRTRRIFRNLESFVGGRVRDGDYRLLRRTD